jgi:hypothetical protein
MLERSDRPIGEVIHLLARHGVEAGYLVPTETGLAKSILDAHGQLRAYLKGRGFHDFDAQQKGADAKQVKQAWHVGPTALEGTKASLYRPETKHGDPRLWISGLPANATAGNLLVLIAHADELYVANASKLGVLESLDDPGSPLGELVRKIASVESAPALELLGKLKQIASMGYVRSLRAGPTGVGMTLETLLGIEANSSKAPDFKGIEIKASRRGVASAARNRLTLFSRAPEWSKSAAPDAVTLVKRFGYKRDGRSQLYCSLGNTPNSLGLFLSIKASDLHAMHGPIKSPERVVQWDMDRLRQALAAKHQQTFWVKATCRRAGDGIEEFQYASAIRLES